MANKSFPLPPIDQPIANAQTGLLSMPWKQWFTEVHREFSRANFQTITSARPVEVDAKYVDLSVASGTYAITLAAPTIPGLIKTMVATDVSGTSITMALTNVVGGSAANTCTWNSTGDTLILISKNNKWVVIKESGVALT